MEGHLWYYAAYSKALFKAYIDLGVNIKMSYLEKEDQEIVDALKRVPIEDYRDIPNESELKQFSKEREKDQPLLQRIFKKIIVGSKTFREIVINANPLERRVALLEDGILKEFSVEYNDKTNWVGAVFNGKIQNLDSGLKAAFVDVGMEKNAFLHYWDALPAATDSSIEVVRKNHSTKPRPLTANKIPDIYPVGSEIMVQIIKDQIGSKGPRITTNIALAGRFIVLMPYGGECGVSKKIENPKERQRLKKILQTLTIPEGAGIIVRTAGEGKKLRYFVRDLHMLLQKWQSILEAQEKNKKKIALLYQEPDLIELSARDFLTEEIDRAIVDDLGTYERMLDLVGKVSKRSKSKIQYFSESIPVFERFNVDRQIEQTFMRHVALPSGGEIVIDEVEALTAIDVNTGSHRNRERDTDKNFIYQVNMEAAQEIARQIKLRNLGGLIIIDFIDMKNIRDRRRLYDLMCNLLKNDAERTQILPISAFGLMQISRQRHSQSTSRDMRATCHYCNGRSFVKSPRTVSIEIHRKLINLMKKYGGAVSSIRVYLHPMVLDYLRNAYEKRLLEIEATYKIKLIFRVDPVFHIENFKILDSDTHSELK
ncbi:MAG: Rne/Rng family ribonuclease [Puniceicoccales bacterium]|jgi:ribonuclease G|nr:Rne/Rng family ribonuclease [Puniceicoccales bacterium]